MSVANVPRSMVERGAIALNGGDPDVFQRVSPEGKAGFREFSRRVLEAAEVHNLVEAVSLMYERCTVTGMSIEQDAFVREALRTARGKAGQ